MTLNNQEWKLHCKILEKVIIEAFNEMDLLFKGTYNEFGQTRYIIGRFIARFDALFTTNQDLLIERQFFHLKQSLEGTPRRSNLSQPGIKPNQVACHITDPIPTWHPYTREFRLDPCSMPYVKLHGCIKGISSAGHLMIMGGKKDDQIEKEPLIKWYFEIFKEKLSEPGSKLLVLGHSFLDSHINKIIFEAVESGNLQFYIWNTSGLDKIFGNLESMNQSGYNNLFQKGLISINTKPLKELFLQNSLLTQELNLLGRSIFEK